MYSSNWLHRYMIMNVMQYVANRVADPDPDLFGRIRIRKIFAGSGSISGSYRYLGNVKFYKQGKNIFKIEVLHIFR